MKTINEINTKTEEGQMLLAAVAKITVESQTYSTPDEVMEQLDVLKNEMYPTTDLDTPLVQSMPDYKRKTENPNPAHL